MSSESYQDTGALRIKRKPAPPFPYSARYPEPDPSDPFASLSVLRDRTATLTNLTYESPVAIPDPTPGSSGVLDHTTFIMHQRKRSAAPGSSPGKSGWQGYASQLRKGASMGLGFHEYSPGIEGPSVATITSTTLRPGAREIQRHKTRRRSQSAFALRSGTFSFLESRAEKEPQSIMELPTKRHSLSPYGSCASVLTSSSTSSRESTHVEPRAGGPSPRPRSCSSSFVSATLFDGVPEHIGDRVPLHKNMHVMQIDMPAIRGTEKRSEISPHVLPPPLEKRSPSESSIGSWSRDLVFYSAPSRPQTPSSIRSSRPASLPPSTTLSFPDVPVNLPPTKPALFTTSPVTSSDHKVTPIPATSFPPDSSNSHRVSTTREDSVVFPNYRFPRKEQSADSEPESVERESGRFARLRARTSTAWQARRSSTSSSLRSTLRAAAEAADKLAAEDASIAAPPAVTLPLRVKRALPVVSEAMSLNASISPEPKELEECQREGVQSRGRECCTEESVPTSSMMHTFPQQNVDGVLVVSRTQDAADSVQRSARPEVKAEPESANRLRKRLPSRNSHKATARRSSSTPLPLSRPLPSPPTITTHPEPMVKLSSLPLPYPHGHELSNTQVQRFSLSQTSSLHGTPQPTSVVHTAPSATSHTGLPAGAAVPRVVHAPTLPVPYTSQFITSSKNYLPPLPSPPRSVQTIPTQSRTTHANTVRSISSNSSHGDNMSTASAPQSWRRDASPSSSHGRHGSHTSERHGIYHHHSHYHTHPRSSSEPETEGLLNSSQLTQAAHMPVVRENGVRVQFGELWRTQRTVVIFIRHFWCVSFLVQKLLKGINRVTSRRCPMCQDYLASVMREVDHAALFRSGVRLVVIGCGSYGLIRSYRRTPILRHLNDGVYLTTISQKSSVFPMRCLSTRLQGRCCTAHLAWATSLLVYRKGAARRSMEQDHTCDMVQ